MHIVKDHDFAVWAFGEKTWQEYLFFEKDGMDLLNAWNEFHGNILRLNPEGSILDDMAKMKEIFEKNRKQ